MTGNKSFLTDYQEIDGGFVAFGGSIKGGKITGKGKIRTRKLDFEDVYFVKELKFNLFSVSQTCDKENNVLFIETEWNQTNKNCRSSMVMSDAVPTQQYILLPLLYDSPQSSEDAVADDAGKKTNEKSANKGERNGQEKDGGASNKEDDQNVQDFRVALDNLLVQQKEVYANSTNRDSTISPFVSAVGQSFTNADDLPTDPLMPNLEVTTNLLNSGIFSGAYDDEDVGAEADLNNLETTMDVSHIPTTRIRKDHPKNQIIRDINSATQIRRMTKISKELAMIASTLIDTNKALLKDEEVEDVDVHLYRSMTGLLMYLIASRPDIIFVVYACARYSPFDLEAFSDSDYAGASLDRKSTTGTEYVAAVNCCGQVLWIQNQMLDYGFNFMKTKIYIDNESTICIMKNPVFHSKTKHIEIRHHFFRDSYEKKLIQVIKIHTDQNVADLLTKAFDFVDQHNMVACLERTEENAEFHQIVDFLTTSSIHYALTVSPTIYASYIEQFWNTANSQTVNDVKQIHAITMSNRQERIGYSRANGDW
ncbi:hypothetical protein Tco_0955900 [Tanacetum coccineum]|uniref:Retrovirus-related Pol polyprotein from transposon TNT 1-94-like beta-barrel domain-containing protein n=1 Tax=Tanacetum coccineum TaxID=301880 RepID=A0ABQ5E8I4_9ASTR